ncbi:MAG: hypothetical protein NT033_04305, partial [Candidatus Omnitrophica bacterium]|nr:hypothetical protein [Candidatus Omnitrophota bacterium]
MLRKILSLIVVVTFLFNEMAFALSPEIVSGNPASPIKSAMYAAGQKLFAMKKGPGSELVRSIDKAMEGVFIGNKPSISGVKFVKADNEQLPKGWEKNPILSKTSLLEAFEYFRDNEARISKKGLNIKEGYFEVDATKGELPIARVEANNDGTYTLILHTKFVQMWNHIRANDIWFKTRGFTVSLAWGIFYRVAKHEMADLTTLSHIQKGGGHLVSDDTKSAEIGVAHPGEHFANMIGGGYSLINDGLWMWFLGSYCFGDSTRYNNDILKDRLGWFFSHEGKELGFAEEFSSYPNALYLPKREVAIKLALAVNYYFFKDRPSAKVPEFTVKPIYIEEAKA